MSRGFAQVSRREDKRVQVRAGACVPVAVRGTPPRGRARLPGCLTMRLASFLKRNRHGVFYLRWVIPSAQPGGQVGRSIEVAVSLRTTCPRHAAAISRDLSARWLWRLPAIRSAARGGNPAAAAMHAELRRAVANWVEQLYCTPPRAGATAEPNPLEAGFVVGAPLPDVVANGHDPGPRFVPRAFPVDAEFAGAANPALRAASGPRDWYVLLRWLQKQERFEGFMLTGREARQEVKRRRERQRLPRPA